MRGRLAALLGAPLCLAHPEEPADAIVVLGSRLREDGSLSAAGEERLRAGADLWRRSIAPLLVVTGGRDPLARAEAVEADAFAARARALGVPGTALLLEREACNTADNARNLAKLLLPERRRVRVVTQPFHLRRALLWFRRAGFDARGHHIADSLQYREPRLGAKWIAQEYVSWLKLFALDSLPRRRRQT